MPRAHPPVIALLACAATASIFAQQPPDTAPPPPADGIAHFGTTVIATGFRGQIYHLHHWTSHLPNFPKMKPVGAIYTTTLNVPPQHFDQGFPGVTKRFEWFGIDYAARFWVQSAGAYHFSLLADDAADLYIDDTLVIDDDGQHPPTRREGSIDLARGLHHIRVPYYQGPKWEVALLLQVIAPGEKTWHVFNTDDFKPPADVKDW